MSGIFNVIAEFFGYAGQIGGFMALCGVLVGMLVRAASGRENFLP